MCHIIYTKRKEGIVKRIFQIWISIFGSAKKFLVDNRGEFDNDEFRSLCENINIRICTTAAESPCSNGIVERHNATLGFSVQKIIDDLKCDLSLAVAWAVSAKTLYRMFMISAQTNWYLGKTQIFLL